MSVSCVGAFVRGFLYKDGAFQTVTVPGAGEVSPEAINNRGDIGGSYFIGSNSFGFLIKANNIETLPNPVSGLNYSGDVVGTLPGGMGYLLRNGVTTPITLPGSVNTLVTGVNDKGAIVGFGDTTGFVLKNGIFTKINYPADAFFTRLNGINNRGQIVGFSIGPAGLTAFIATPVRTEE
jgi:uncharacterized membrane protein